MARARALLLRSANLHDAVEIRRGSSLGLQRIAALGLGRAATVHSLGFYDASRRLSMSFFKNFSRSALLALLAVGVLGTARPLRAEVFIRRLECRNPDATPMYKLGLKLIDAQRPAAAAEAFLGAAKKGCEDAMVELGILYERGNGVPQNYRRAYGLFNLAASRSANTASLYREAVFHMKRIQAAIAAQDAQNRASSAPSYPSGDSPSETPGDDSLVSLDRLVNQLTKPIFGTLQTMQDCARGNDQACVSTGEDPKDPCRRYYGGETSTFLLCQGQLCNAGNRTACETAQRIEGRIGVSTSAEDRNRTACESNPHSVWTGTRCASNMR
jgi:TPR repeat protein